MTLPQILFDLLAACLLVNSPQPPGWLCIYPLSPPRSLVMLTPSAPVTLEALAASLAYDLDISQVLDSRPSDIANIVLAILIVLIVREYREDTTCAPLSAC